VHAPSPTTEPGQAAFGRPQVYFFCELRGPALLALLDEPLIAQLAANGFGVALATSELDEAAAAAARRLSRHGIPLVAWLMLEPADGLCLNLRNYPQAIERYRAFHAWAQGSGLRFRAVGLDIEPPASALAMLQPRGAGRLVRRVQHARGNGLLTAARSAYTDLIASIHHDGYEVHTYQLPILADDRRAGSTLAQRTLDIVDLPADVEVLRCYSSAPLDRLGTDLGGALVHSYGPDADGIAVGTVSATADADAPPSLSWDALERDLVLAGHHTDTIYVYSLEGCAERGLIPRIGRVDWDHEPAVPARADALVALARAALLAGLLLARFSRDLFAWLGWALFAVLLARQLRAAVQRR
jgi:hypothetical protein